MGMHLSPMWASWGLSHTDLMITRHTRFSISAFGLKVTPGVWLTRFETMTGCRLSLSYVGDHRPDWRTSGQGHCGSYIFKKHFPSFVCCTHNCYINIWYSIVLNRLCCSCPYCAILLLLWLYSVHLRWDFVMFSTVSFVD